MPVEFPDVEPWHAQPLRSDWTLADLIQRAAVRNAEREALWSRAHGSLTHGEMARRAARVRGAMLAAGGSARTIACLASLNAPLFVGLHAIFTAGKALAALDPEAPEGRNRMCLEDCGADLILTDAGAAARAEALADGRRPVILIDDAAEHADPAPSRDADPAAPAAYVFTSGSTGRPKAVVRSQRSMARAMYCLAEVYDYRAEDTMLYPGSPGHIGSLNDVLSCMIVGFRSLPIDIAQVDLPTIADLLESHRVDRLSMPPSLLRLMLRVLAERRRTLQLRCVIGSGEPLLRSDVSLFHEVLPGVELWQNYGSTETGPMAAGRYLPDDARGSGPLPLRRTHLGCALEIVDDDGDVVEAGVIGDVRVRSEFLADGYLNAPPDQAARFGADERGRFFMIGDRGHRQANGELFIAGRGDRQIKLHGRRLELGDVESAILSNRAWTEAVVVQTPSPAGIPSLVAVVRPAHPSAADLPALRDSIAALLPAAAIPRRFVVVKDMPRTTTGKIDLTAAVRLATEGSAITLGAGGPP